MPTVNDPLVPLQWHLSMVGQLGFGTGGTGLVGLERVWADYRGQNVHVGQWDVGVQTSHWDLAANYDASRQLVIEGTLNDGLPLFVGFNEHGTAVAGLIAAARNGIGGVGVAYEAGLTSVRVLGGADDLSTQFPRYLLTLDHLSDFDVTNHSYGSLPTFVVDQDQARFAAAAESGRNGLGTVMVYASGNNNTDANGEQIGVLRQTVTVGAVEADGQVSPYANYGANLLVTAPASSVTTDLLGNGVGRDGLLGGDYTDNFGGTSGSTPVVTGVVALMLSANPGLGWRDVQNILALSATGTGSLYGGPDTNENAVWAWNGDTHWNGGGQHFSADYGYGLVNAFNAVRLSEAWAVMGAPALTSANEQAVDTGTVALALPVNDLSTTTWTFNITNGLAIESVTLALGLTHGSLTDNLIRLVSPSGTVMTIYDGSLGTADQAVNGFDYTFGIAGLHGESALGTWQLLVQDRVAGHSGTLDNARFVAYGTTPVAADVYHYTDEVATVLQQPGQTGRLLLTDNDGGTDWLDAATMWRDLVIDLNAGASSTLQGIAFTTLASSTQIENALAGDGNDQLQGNGLDNRLFGMRGDDMLIGAQGHDALSGGPGNDVLEGGPGDDLLDGGLGSDTASYANAGSAITVSLALAGPQDTLGAGTDTLVSIENLIGSNFDDRLTSNADGNRLDGGAGSDTVSYEAALTGVSVALVAATQATGGSGSDTLVSIENLIGSASADQLAGDSASNRLQGQAGNDLLFGAEGDDLLFGGADNDLMFGDAGVDQVDGGTGDDVAYGGAGNDVLSGGAGHDVLSGDAGDDTLDGGQGDDLVYGVDGDDLLLFDGTAAASGPARDAYDGGTGADTLELTLSDAQMASAAVRGDLDNFAGYIASHFDLNTNGGPVYSFSTLALDARNIEQLVVNGAVYTGARARVHIDPTAPEGGNGSLLKPFNEWRDVNWQPNTDYLQKAGTVAVASFTVSVQGTADAPVTIGSYGDEPTGGARNRPQIQGAITFDNASYVTLQGMDIYGAPFGAVTLLDGANHITVRDNEIRDSQAGVLIRASAGGDNRIDGNVVHNNAGQGIAMAGGVQGHGDVIAYNSIIANGLHGIEISSNYSIIEYNEVMSNGNLTIGTSGIHTHVEAYGDGTGHDLVIRLNVVGDSQENFGPDGNGIELDRWTRNVDVYSNVLYGNDGQGFVAFQAKDWRAFDNVIFDNMKSEAHNNYARPTEALILSYSLVPNDQTERFIFVDNLLASSGRFSGSSDVDIVPVLVDAPTIFWSRLIANNTLYSANNGDLFNWGFSPDEIWGPGEIGTDIARWNELKGNGTPDILGNVQMQSLDGIIQGSDKIDLMQGGTGDDYLIGGANADVLIGGAGDDVLDSGSGIDRLIGGRGNDIYIVDNLEDRIWEFPDSGTDTVYTTFSYALPAYVENALMQGHAVAGLAGNDLVNFLEGNDATNGIQGNGASDVLLGHGGNDNLIGGSGDDYIDGGSENDLLQGGTGDDVLVGGTGDDVFVIYQGEGHDTVLDYEGWYALHGDLLEFHGYGPDAALNYTGSEGLWRIDFTQDGIALVEYVSLVGVALMSAVDDYVFVEDAAPASALPDTGETMLPDVSLSSPAADFAF